MKFTTATLLALPLLAAASPFASTPSLDSLILRSLDERDPSVQAYADHVKRSADAIIARRFASINIMADGLNPRSAKGGGGGKGKTTGKGGKGGSSGSGGGDYPPPPPGLSADGMKGVSNLMSIKNEYRINC